MKRVFIAVKIDAGEFLSGIVKSLKEQFINDNIRWTPFENMHLTLIFIGNIDDEKIETIRAIMIEKCNNVKKFEFMIQGIGIFKNNSDPRILWAGINPSEELNRLNELIKVALFGSGIKTEERSFNPHLTLGRIKNVHDKYKFKETVMKYGKTELQKVKVNEVILFESILLQSGPVYKALNIYGLR